MGDFARRGETPENFSWLNTLVYRSVGHEKFDIDSSILYFQYIYLTT